MEPSRFRDRDHPFEEHSGRIAPQKRAEENHRSLSKEIIATIRSAASGTHGADVEAMIREARAARAKKISAPDQRR